MLQCVLGERFLKLNFFDIRAIMTVLTIKRLILPGGRSRETQNRRVC